MGNSAVPECCASSHIGLAAGLDAEFTVQARGGGGAKAWPPVLLGDRHRLLASLAGAPAKRAETVHVQAPEVLCTVGEVSTSESVGRRAANGPAEAKDGQVKDDQMAGRAVGFTRAKTDGWQEPGCRMQTVPLRRTHSECAEEPPVRPGPPEEEELRALLQGKEPAFRAIHAVRSEDTLLGDHHQYTEAEEEILRQAKMRWTYRQQEVDRRRRAQELGQLLRQTRAQMLADPPHLAELPIANRFGSDARFPVFNPEKHVPLLALINPYSGAMAGSDILAIARRSPYYQDRFFNIIDVVKDQRKGGLLDVFRQELCKAKAESKTLGVRPRIISGGGDGTASFSLYIIFAALRADEARADEGLSDSGNGFIWTDEEMEECFPALAQMPLGSANDFGHTLGWGDRYPGDGEIGGCSGPRGKALRSLQAWIEAVISRSSKIANFDLYGMMPTDGHERCNFKLAELTGRRGMDPKVVVDGERHLLMKEAGTPVPLFCCLYFSAGFAAYMTARFQINRRGKPFHNKMEYARQAFGILTERVPPELGVGLDCVNVTCGGDQYFPPRSQQGNSGSRYREVGFLNINWQAGMANGADRASLCGRLFRAGQPAKFNDGKIDMYRLKFGSALRNPGFRIQTDKKEGGMTLTHTGGLGKGIFFQWDGESRFAFSPTGETFHINIRKILNVPVVLGPQYDARVTGDPDNGREVRFQFAGDNPSQREAVRQRLIRCVRGELNKELNASRDDIVAAGLQCH